MSLAIPRHREWGPSSSACGSPISAAPLRRLFTNCSAVLVKTRVRPSRWARATAEPKVQRA
eukprot:1702528-Pyramimonas_sp.AAC.1